MKERKLGCHHWYAHNRTMPKPKIMKLSAMLVTIT